MPQVDLTDTDDEEENTMPDNFDQAVSRIARRDNVKKSAAMTKAVREFPELFEKYQAEGIAKAEEALADAMRPIQKSAAVVGFEKRIDAVQARDACSRLEALTKAAREFPQEREAYATALS